MEQGALSAVGAILQRAWDIEPGKSIRWLPVLGNNFASVDAPYERNRNSQRRISQL